MNSFRSGFSIYLQILTVSTFCVHNFPLNLRSSRFSISPHIQTFHTHITYTISRWIDEILDILFLHKTKHSVYLLYTISRGIFAVLDFQFICKSKHSVHVMYIISRWIYIFQDIQHLCESRYSVHIKIYTSPTEFTKFWIFNFSLEPDFLYI